MYPITFTVIYSVMPVSLPVHILDGQEKGFDFSEWTNRRSKDWPVQAHTNEKGPVRQKSASAVVV